ncbi:phage-shock protein [Bowmanella sp. JS7-9]|nr:phage-shock protein [Bowmanella sp. JS7-9]
MEEAISIPLILFMIFVAPIWVIMHYRARRQISQGLSEEEKTSLHNLADKAESMAERIRTLEQILDAESPDWRNKV